MALDRQGYCQLYSNFLMAQFFFSQMRFKNALKIENASYKKNSTGVNSSQKWEGVVKNTFSQKKAYFLF